MQPQGAPQPARSGNKAAVVWMLAIVATFFPVLTRAAPGTSAAASSFEGMRTFPFIVRNGFILIAGSVDETGGVFMLDTGTPFSFFLNRELVPLAGGKLISQGRAASGQPILVQLHEGIHSIRLDDDNIFPVTEVRSGDLGFVGKALNAPFLGFVGLALLRDYEFVLDYRNNVVTLRPIGQEPKQSEMSASPPLAVLSFTMDGQIPRVVLRVGGFDISARLDTGAQGSAALTAATRERFQRAGLLVRNQRAGSTKFEILSAECGGRTFDLANLDDTPSTTDEITLGYTFLRNYRSVWNYRKMTVSLYANR